MDSNKLCALIGEDNLPELRLFQIAAQETGLIGVLNLHTAMDGEEVIAKLEKSAANGVPFELLILDLNMPRVSGMDVMKYLQTDFPARKPVIIVLTNSNNPSDMARSKDLGADIYLQKPADFADIETFCNCLKTSIQTLGKICPNYIRIQYNNIH